MWRSFFFAVGTILIFLGLQCLVFEEFRIDKNSRLFAVAKKANRAFDETSGQALDAPGSQYRQSSAVANQQRFSLPSAESYYGGASRFQASGYPTYNGVPASNSNLNRFGDGNIAGPQVKALHRYPVRDWMPWGFLAAGTIISLYTNSTGHSNYSGD